MSLSCLLHLPCTFPDSRYQSFPWPDPAEFSGNPLEMTTAHHPGLRILQGYPLRISQVLGSPGIPTAGHPGSGIPGDTHCTSPRSWDPQGYPLHVTQALGSPGIPTAYHPGLWESFGDTHCTSLRPQDPPGIPTAADHPDPAIPGDTHCMSALALFVAQTLSCAVVGSCLWLLSVLLLDNTDPPNRCRQWCASSQVY